MRFIELTARDLARDSLPNLCRNKQGTVSSCFHNKWYNGPLLNWDLFEKEAYKLCNRFESLPQGIVAVKPDVEGGNEKYLCGAEPSVSLYFKEHVLHPVLITSEMLGLDQAFGDFKICDAQPESQREVPDYVAVAPVANAPDSSIKYYRALRLVGEVKTPWNHDLPKLFAPHKENKPAGPLRHAIGQIVQYMHQYNMRYGFLTTYEVTIFLKQEYRPAYKDWAVYISNPIKHTTKTMDLGDVGDDTHPSTFVDQVSIRQCMIYLLHLTETDYKVKNPTDLSHWIKRLASLVNLQVPPIPESLVGKKLAPPISTAGRSSLKRKLDSDRGIRYSGPTTRSAGLGACSQNQIQGVHMGSIAIRRKKEAIVYDITPLESGNYRFTDPKTGKMEEIPTDDVRKGAGGRTFAKVSGVYREVRIVRKKRKRGVHE